ncbi:MAG: GvpL/GvpF family gas vesicle protein [Thermodesulfovibrionales bacterium]|nr:GvpL/GvpF family gas vesicle protein [Thermodesulfovibrionales bacterium]
MGEGKYLYGIIKTNEKKSFGPCGINANEEVYAIVHQDVACVVSNSPVQDYSSMLKETLGRLLVKHQTVIEKVMQDHSIIPMKFGTFASNDEVIEVLKRGYSQFKELLINMDGKIELDVTATYNDLNSIIKEIGDVDKGIRKFKAEIAKRSPHQTLQDRIKIGMMVKDALDKRREKEEAHIIDFLKKFTIDSQKHQLMDDKMILNCAFLLEKVKEPDFDTALKELDKEYNQKVNFRCVGPLPPYSFATCQLKKVGYSQIDEAKRLLGLGESTSLEEIKESYREFAQRNHPDKHPENSQLKEEFEKVTYAYRLLTSCYQGENINFKDNRQKDFIVIEIIRP